MKISDLLSLSVKNLLRRKGRTALTVVGVVVGTCAVIVMISLGIATNKSTEEMLQSWGDLTEIEVYNWSNGNGQPPDLNLEMVNNFTKMNHVLGATPYYNPWNLNGSILAGKKERYATELYELYGVLPEALQPMGFELESGKWLSSEDKYPEGKIPVLVGGATAYNFHDTKKKPGSSKYQRWYGDTDAAGNLIPPFFDIDKEKLTLQLKDYEGHTKEYELVVVGHLAEDEKQYWTRYGIVMRMDDVRMLEAAFKKMTGDKSSTAATYDSVHIKVDDVNNVDAVSNAITGEYGYYTWSMTEIRESMKEQVAQQQMILGGLAAISLLVAALNIANTMTMAIYERTREIGVMKVLGCKLGTIRAMFLLESGFIGFFGGMVGSVVSLLISFILNNIATILMVFGGQVDFSGLQNMLNGGWGGSGGTTISIVPPWLVLAALAFATMIGLLSGVMPANRAMKISALEAIRHE